MNTNAATTEPTMGDIGPEEEVEFEPLEVPVPVPAEPEKVPA